MKMKLYSVTKVAKTKVFLKSFLIYLANLYLIVTFVVFNVGFFRTKTSLDVKFEPKNH